MGKKDIVAEALLPVVLAEAETEKTPALCEGLREGWNELEQHIVTLGAAAIPDITSLDQRSQYLSKPSNTHTHHLSHQLILH